MVRVLFATLILPLSLVSLQAAPPPKLGTATPVAPYARACCGDAAAAALAGNSFAVFWQAGSEIVASRVNAAGEAVGAPLPISDSVAMPLLAESDGMDVLLLRTTASEMVEANRLTSDLRPIGQWVSLFRGVALDVLFDGVDYVVVYVQDGGLWLARVSRDGRVLASRRVAGATPSRSASLAWNGANYALTWTNFTPIPCVNCYSSGYVRVAAFNRSLEVLPSQELGPGSYPEVVWTGMSFVVVWTDLQRIFTARFDGGVSAASGAEVETAFNPSRSIILLSAKAVWNGRSISVAFTSGFEDSSLYSLQLDSSGRGLNDTLVRLPGYYSHVRLTPGRLPGTALLIYSHAIADPYGSGLFARSLTSEPAPVLRRAVGRPKS